MAAFADMGWQRRLETRFGVPRFARAVTQLWVQDGVGDHLDECLVAVDHRDRVVGVSSTHILVPGAVGDLKYLAVAADWRGRGIGRRLVNASLDRFRDLGLPLAVISYDHDNLPAARLYESCGYSPLRRLVLYARAIRARPLVPPPSARNSDLQFIHAQRPDVGALARTTQDRYGELTAAADLNGKHGSRIDVLPVLHASFTAAVRGSDACLLGKRQGASVGMLAWAAPSGGPVAEIQVLLADNLEVGERLAWAAVHELWVRGKRAAYCWLPEADSLGRDSLAAQGFEPSDAAVWLSLELESGADLDLHASPQADRPILRR